jgi:uncharacterized protein YndB with AHSA1/START domain
MEEISEQVLVITRVLAARRELVFQAWTNPKHVRRWWGPHGFTNPVCELDVKPGGAMRIDMLGPDGKVYPMRGVFHEIVPPERLVFTSMAVENGTGKPILEVLNTVTFTDLGSQTRLTLEARVVRATPEAAEALAGMETGWSQALERLEESLQEKQDGQD